MKTLDKNLEVKMVNIFSRVMIKLSGEALTWFNKEFGIDSDVVDKIAIRCCKCSKEIIKKYVL